MSAGPRLSQKTQDQPPTDGTPTAWGGGRGEGGGGRGEGGKGRKEYAESLGRGKVSNFNLWSTRNLYNNQLDLQSICVQVILDYFFNTAVENKNGTSFSVGEHETFFFHQK